MPIEVPDLGLSVSNRNEPKTRRFSVRFRSVSVNRRICFRKFYVCWKQRWMQKKIKKT